MEDFVFMQQHVNAGNLYLAILRRTREQIRTRNEFDVGAVPRPLESSWAYLSRFGDNSAFLNILGINRDGFYRLV